MGGKCAGESAEENALLKERAAEEGDVAIAIVPVEGGLRMATALQMKGRVVSFYMAVVALLISSAGAAVLFWRPGGIIDANGGNVAAPEVIVGLVVVGLACILGILWGRTAFLPPTPLYGEGGTNNEVFTDVDAGEPEKEFPPKREVESTFPSPIPPTEVGMELQLAPLGTGEGAEEAA